MRNKLTMKYPTSWHGDMWREAAPTGNGKIGAMIYGGIHKEFIQIVHSDLWRVGVTKEIPNVTESHEKMRKLLFDNKPLEAEHLVNRALIERGYGEVSHSIPLPLCDINVTMPSKEPFKNYRRIIDMETGEVSVSWREGDTRFNRKLFVSRLDDVIAYKIEAQNTTIEADITIDMHDTETLNSLPIHKNLITVAKDSYIFYSVQNGNSGDYGAVARVLHDGNEECRGGQIKITSATYITIFAYVFINESRDIAFQRLRNTLAGSSFDYDQALEDHAKVHRELFMATSFNLYSDGHEKSTEELLLEAYEGEAPNALVEKLWSFGRYLLLCATNPLEQPCHLYGLWTGDYNAMWAFNMFNVNLQMIYWQTLTGNMPFLLQTVFNYLESHLEDYRENARKLYGCRGINIPSVSTPESGLHKCLAPHILHWTGGAGWISQHYYDYYVFTGDKDFLVNRAMPFMYEASLFYEDFLTVGQDGYLIVSPSNSPENTPGNVMEMTGGRKSEVAVNATMDFAIIKELHLNLIEGSMQTGLYKEKIAVWQQIIDKIPPYMINQDGAVQEWMHPFYTDNYEHRHHSHLYPVFPGSEVTKHKSPELFKAFETALDKRLEFGLKDQSGWSLAYMANIFSRMGKGDAALECLDILTRTNTMSNLVTVHNDWRRMGTAMCNDMRQAPVQIDANMGITAAMQEMVIFSTLEHIHLLPALPERWVKGSVGPLLARGNIEVTINWDKNTGEGNVQLYNKGKERKVLFLLPDNLKFEDDNKNVAEVMLLAGIRISLHFTL